MATPTPPTSYGAQAPSDVGKIITLGEWMLILLVLIIPIVNLIMLFVWGFTGAENPSRQNYCRAALIWAAIGIVLWLLMFMVFGAAMMGGMRSQ